MLWSELSPERNLIPGFAPLFSSCVHRFSPGILVSSHSPETGSSGWLQTLNCPQVWMNGMCTLHWTDDLYWGNKKQSQTDEWTGLTLSHHLQQGARQRFMSVSLSASKQTWFGWFKWSYLQRRSRFMGNFMGPNLLCTWSLALHLQDIQTYHHHTFSSIFAPSTFVSLRTFEAVKSLIGVHFACCVFSF